MPKREYDVVGVARAPHGLVEVTASRKVGSKGKGKAENGKAEEKPFKYDTFGVVPEPKDGKLDDTAAVAWAQFVGSVLAAPDHKVTVTSWDGTSRDMILADLYESWVYGEDMGARQAATNAEVDTWVPAGPKHDLNLVTGAIRERATKALMAETFNVSLAERLTDINTTYVKVARAKALDPDTSSYVPKNMAEAVRQLLASGAIVGQEGSFTVAPTATPAPAQEEPKAGKPNSRR